MVNLASLPRKLGRSTEFDAEQTFEAAPQLSMLLF
jgi:hypothetical protein